MVACLSRPAGDTSTAGLLLARGHDEAAASTLRDLVRGFLAFAKLQAGARPELQTLVQSVNLGGTGTTVTLSFSLPLEMFDLCGAAMGRDVVNPP